MAFHKNIILVLLSLQKNLAFKEGGEKDKLMQVSGGTSNRLFEVLKLQQNFQDVKKKSYPFDPLVFRGYSHVNTLDEKSAIKDHKSFITRVFMQDE